MEFGVEKHEKETAIWFTDKYKKTRRGVRTISPNIPNLLTAIGIHPSTETRDMEEEVKLKYKQVCKYLNIPEYTIKQVWLQDECMDYYADPWEFPDEETLHITFNGVIQELEDTYLEG